MKCKSFQKLCGINSGIVLQHQHKYNSQKQLCKVNYQNKRLAQKAHNYSGWKLNVCYSVYYTVES